MKNCLVEDKRIISGSGAIKNFAATVSPKEDMRKRVRRVVRNAAVPYDLELRVWNSLRKMIKKKV